MAKKIFLRDFLCKPTEAGAKERYLSLVKEFGSEGAWQTLGKMEAKFFTTTEGVHPDVNLPVGAAQHLPAVTGSGATFWGVIGLALVCVIWGRRILRLLD